VKAQCGRELPLAVTEFNMGAITNTPKPYRFSYGAALECVDLMRVFLQPENGVATANYWQFANAYWGMLETQDPPAEFEVKEHAAYPVFRLFGSHVGQVLVETRVQAPKKTAEGFTGVYPANAQTHEPGGELLAVIDREDIQKAIQLDSFSDKELAAMLSGGTFTVMLRDLSKSRYPVFATIRRPAGVEGPCDYRLSYEARFVGAPDVATPPASVGIMDSRGYSQTGSAMRIAGGTGHEWSTYSGVFNALVDAPGVSLLARVEGGGGLTGSLEVRNMGLEVLAKERFPAYSLLTAMTSLSLDGSKAYLIVINKSDTEDIETSIQVEGFKAESGKLWEVNGPGLLALEGVRQTKDGVSVSIEDGGSLTHVFPAHSITAIELVQ